MHVLPVAVLLFSAASAASGVDEDTVLRLLRQDRDDGVFAAALACIDKHTTSAPILEVVTAAARASDEGAVHFRTYRAARFLVESTGDHGPLDDLRRRVRDTAHTTPAARADLVEWFAADGDADALVAALADPSVLVRFVAIGELERGTGSARGYRYRASVAADRDAIAAWQAWLAHPHAPLVREAPVRVPAGIGATVVDEDGRCVVTSVLSGFPADGAGFARGDVIEAVDGDDVGGLPCADVARYRLLGPPDTTLIVDVQKPDGRRVHEELGRRELRAAPEPVDLRVVPAEPWPELLAPDPRGDFPVPVRFDDTPYPFS